MPNLFWYIGLAAIGIVSAAYSIYRKREVFKVSTLLVFYLATAGSAWVAEFIVLGLFNSYFYKTGVYEDLWLQNLLGHLILNTTLYPASAVVMAAFSLKYRWIFFVAAFLVSVEYLFVKMGLYEHIWWKYYMTVIAVIVFLSTTNKWFENIKDKCCGATRLVTFYFTALLKIHFPAPILLLAGKQYYEINFVQKLFGNLYLSSIVIIFFYHMVEAFLLVFVTCILKKWYWKLLPFLISIVVQSILAYMNVLVLENGWKLFYTLLIYEVFIAAYILTEKYTLN